MGDSFGLFMSLSERIHFDQWISGSKGLNQREPKAVTRELLTGSPKQCSASIEPGRGR